MKKRLNYRELLKNWMQYYEISAERSKKTWVVILSHLHTSRSKKGYERRKNK